MIVPQGAKVGYRRILFPVLPEYGVFLCAVFLSIAIGGDVFSIDIEGDADSRYHLPA